MEIASPLPIQHGRGGTKRSFACSPFMDDEPGTFRSAGHMNTIMEGFNSCGTAVSNNDMSCGNAFKRRRFTSDDNMEDNFTSNSRQSIQPYQHQPNAPCAKRARTEAQSNVWNQVHAKEQIAIELKRVVDQQAAEIERLKSEKVAVVEAFTKLKTEQDKTVNENRILKRAITIQQDRQNLAHNEIEAATKYREAAEERIRKLEQMNLKLRYHLQATQPSVGNDFMGFSPRPPDVY